MLEYGFTPESAHAVVASTEAMALMFVAMAFTRPVKEEVRRRQANKCDSCGEEQIPLPIHHRRPESRGGSSVNIENAVGLDDDCHQEIDRETFDGRTYPQVHTKERYYPQGNGLAGNIYPSQPRK